MSGRADTCPAKSVTREKRPNGRRVQHERACGVEGQEAKSNGNANVYNSMHAGGGVPVIGSAIGGREKDACVSRKMMSILDGRGSSVWTPKTSFRYEVRLVS